MSTKKWIGGKSVLRVGNYPPFWTPVYIVAHVWYAPRDVLRFPMVMLSYTVDSLRNFPIYFSVTSMALDNPMITPAPLKQPWRTWKHSSLSIHKIKTKCETWAHIMRSPVYELLFKFTRYLLIWIMLWYTYIHISSTGYQKRGDWWCLKHIDQTRIIDVINKCVSCTLSSQSRNH